jgi:hypothetical protein
MFDKVVKLTVNQCVQGMTSEQVQFRDLLLRLRKDDSTVDDWKLLLTRQPSNVTNLCDFEDSTRLFYSNEQVANYNHEQLTKLEHPIAHINARHLSALAKNISSHDMSDISFHTISCKSPFSNLILKYEKSRVSLFLLFMYDFAVHFSSEGPEHVQLSFSPYVKISLNLVFYKSSNLQQCT